MAAGVGVFLTGFTPSLAFDCAETLCSKMSTCAEAYYKLEVCGHGKRDADHDGIPCEDLCGKDIATYLARAKTQWPKEMAFIPRRSPEGLIQAIPDAQAEEGITPDSVEAFTCSGKRTCNEMLSCEEAEYYLANCGARKLDGDGDGVPCNSLCR